MTKRTLIPVKLWIVGIVSTLIIMYAWSRSLLGRPLQLGNQRFTWLGLVYLTGGYLFLLVAPWLTNRLALTPFEFMAMTDHLALGWLGYLVLILVVPVWFQPANSGLVLGIIFAIVGGICIDVPRNGVWGVRIPWTYGSPMIWKKVNGLMGRLLLVASYSMVGVGWVWPAAFPIYQVVVIVGILVLVLAYAHQLHLTL
ncbi:SdpI family protein [Lactiplantibacillus paraplantarum]|uniref:SdpI family protein n=1 Tax=Lactiplantibacillus paraplantarum TaxID=60520 RepID=UPI003DA5F1AC